MWIKIYSSDPTKLIKDFYISLFIKCVKCGQKINPNLGYWHWQNIPPLKGGYYHPDCGMLNNSITTGLLPFDP